MKKEILIRILIVVVTALVSYVMIGYAKMEFNPLNWSTSTRLLHNFALVFGIWMAFYPGKYIDDED